MLNNISIDTFRNIEEPLEIFPIFLNRIHEFVIQSNFGENGESLETVDFIGREFGVEIDLLLGEFERFVQKGLIPKKLFYQIFKNSYKITESNGPNSLRIYWLD